ncbi:MAG: histidine phosphatase family protein [Cyanobacteria bacterium P01_H01_bin.21]
MVIVLVRHGQPTVTSREWINGHEIPRFASRYRTARISSDSLPPEELRLLVQSAKAIFTSDLPRSIHSAQILMPSISIVSNPIFREIDFMFQFPINIRLPALIWIILARLFWGLGYSPYSHSQLDAKNQAKQAVDFLEQQSSRIGSIVLVGHGLTNLFIARELKRRGWRGPRTPNIGHWSYAVYSL